MQHDKRRTLSLVSLLYHFLMTSHEGPLPAGYLPSFWIKLRMLSAPAINSTAVHGWPVSPTESLTIVMPWRTASPSCALSDVPEDVVMVACMCTLSVSQQCGLLQVLFGGITHWTVGLIATFMTVACTIAADTGAYAFGRTLGRTQLISISPKKTVEGAIGGLACSTVVALAFWRFLRWPAQVSARLPDGGQACNA